MAGWRWAGLVLGVGVGVTVIAACSGNDEGGDSEVAAEVPVLLLSDEEVAFDEQFILEAENGTVVSAEVVTEEKALDGTLDGAAWVSAETPLPGATYTVSAEVTDSADETHTLDGSFTVAEVPEDRRLTLSVIRGGGDAVGVGAPIIIKFDQAVTERAGVEEALTVSSDPQVVGAWRWLNDQEVHFRPEEYWPAGTTIRADLDLNGVHAGADVWGGRSYSYDIEVGSEQVARVDASTQVFSLIKDGEAIDTFLTSLGSKEYETRNGIYVVQSKDRKYTMSSCTANITCNPGEGGYYPEIDTEFAVRLTNSGTFVHSAPWSRDAQGRENVSHGCVNLNEADAKKFYDMVRYGDIVEVVGSTREPDDLVERGDPGMVDWNLSWEQFVASSELGEFTTEAL